MFVFAAFGLICGSFVNAFVWRLRKQETTKSKAARRSYSIMHGRSMCPSCRHQLAPKDLVPVLSWMWLRGRCRYCQASIGWQYPLVELATAALFALSYVVWPMNFDAIGSVRFVLWLVILTGLMALAVYDLKWMLLPNRVVYPLGVLALLYVVIGMSADDVVQELYRLISSVGVGGGLFYLLFQLSEGRWIGGGDVKLGAVLGILLSNPYHAFLMIFLASLLGTLAIVPGLILKRTSVSSKIPFGPFLILATILVVLFGAGMIDTYQNWLYAAVSWHV